MMHPELKTKNAAALVALAAAALFAFFILVNGYAQPLPFLTLREINAQYSNAYIIARTSQCQGGTALQKTGIVSICTEVLGIRNRSSATLPANITLMYYRFSSNSKATLFIQNVTRYLNSTSWPAGVRVSGNTTTGFGNVTVYYTTTVDYTQPQVTVIAAYTLYNSNVIGVSSFMQNSSDVYSAKQVALSLLYLQYRKVATATG